MLLPPLDARLVGVRALDHDVDVGMCGELVSIARAPYGLKILERGVIGNTEALITVNGATAGQAAVRCVEGDDVQPLRQSFTASRTCASARILCGGTVRLQKRPGEARLLQNGYHNVSGAAPMHRGACGSAHRVVHARA